MQQRGNGNAFCGIGNTVELLYAGAIHIMDQALINIEAVLAKAAFISAVIACAGRGREEIAGIRAKIGQKAISTLAGDIFLKDLNKFFLVCHRDMHLRMERFCFWKCDETIGIIS
jgi:hypothetical protein